MRINNNLSAVITNNQLLDTESSLADVMEKLSSGFNINHASDDPSGIAIAGKMQAQIDGLGKASNKSSDGISVLQTAEGALKEETDMEEILCRLFRENREDDIRMGFTSAGPHRDDLILSLNKNQMKQFASQGQIRTAALSMKLSQMQILRDLSGEEPVLLLDDVMSELDRKRRACLIGEISNFQTFITCADRNDVDHEKVDRMWEVSAEEGEAGVREIQNSEFRIQN